MTLLLFFIYMAVLILGSILVLFWYSLTLTNNLKVSWFLFKISVGLISKNRRNVRTRALGKLFEREIQLELTDNKSPEKQDKNKISKLRNKVSKFSSKDYECLAKKFLKNIHEVTPIGTFIGRSRAFESPKNVAKLLETINAKKHDEQDLVFYEDYKNENKIKPSLSVLIKSTGLNCATNL